MMKKTLSAALFICIMLSLCSCRVVVHSKQMEALNTEVHNFDLRAAEEMIAPGERLIADITSKSTVTRQEFDQLLDTLSGLYGDDISRNKWVAMLIDSREYEDESVTELSFSDRLFYPTIYHENVELVAATVTDLYYEDPSLDISLLTITVAYTGDDENLKDWQRDYTYVMRDGSEWVYDHGAGGNASGEDLTHDYLPVHQ